MMTMVQYWQERFDMAETFEAFDEVMEEAIALYEALCEEEIDIDVWAKSHDVDIYAKDESGFSYFEMWCWDMCGE